MGNPIKSGLKNNENILSHLITSSHIRMGLINPIAQSYLQKPRLFPPFCSLIGERDRETEPIVQFKTEGRKKKCPSAKAVRQEEFPHFRGRSAFLLYLGLQLMG